MPKMTFENGTIGRMINVVNGLFVFAGKSYRRHKTIFQGINFRWMFLYDIVNDIFNNIFDEIGNIVEMIIESIAINTTSLGDMFDRDFVEWIGI